MSPVLASPFKSPMAVIARIKQWSSRKSHRSEPPSPASPILTHKAHSKPSDSAVGQRSDFYCTPHSSHACVVSTPDSGIHTGPKPQSLSGEGRSLVMKSVSSPIPIVDGSYPGSSHCPRLKAISASLHLKKEALSKDAPVEVEEAAQSGEPSSQNKDVQRPSITSIASSAVSFATSTTTLPSENSYSDCSEYGESWCLKLSDLDSPACLSPHSPGWLRLAPEAGKPPCKQTCKAEQRVERVESQSKELGKDDEFEETVGASKSDNIHNSSGVNNPQVKK